MCYTNSNTPPMTHYLLCHGCRGGVSSAKLILCINVALLLITQFQLRGRVWLVLSAEVCATVGSRVGT